MKSLLFALTLFVAAVQAHAGENLVCVTQEANNPANFFAYKVDLENMKDDNYMGSTDDSLNMGYDDFSYVIDVYRKSTQLEIIVTFQENNHVQDEVGQYEFVVDLTKAQPGQHVLHEVLEVDENSSINFFCYYNR